MNNYNKITKEHKLAIRKQRMNEAYNAGRRA